MADEAPDMPLNPGWWMDMRMLTAAEEIPDDPDSTTAYLPDRDGGPAMWPPDRDPGWLVLATIVVAFVIVFASTLVIVSQMQGH